MAPPPAYYDRLAPTRGPSPWIPATILGIILFIATTPYRMAPDVAMAYGHPARRSASFPPALIWIPVIFFLVIQFFGGSYRPYRYDRLGRPGMRAASYGGGLAGGYGDAGVYPPYDNYNRFNVGPYADRGLMGSFMDYGGHWLLILLGIWLFSLVGTGSAPAHTAAIPPPRLGFPWSLFAPQPQIVLPMM